MEINGTNPLIVSNNSTQRLDSPQQSEQSAKGGGSPPDTDRLELSVRSREISHLNDLIQSIPDVRDAKVEQVRRELENGTYNVKAEKIADKIIGGNLLDEVF
jgi:negative regulator of flagellin synthesis FlgM